MLGCRHLANEQELPDTKNDGTTVTKFEYQQCRSNSLATLYRINDGGHPWLGAKSAILKRIVGKTSKDIIACDEMWEFFSSLK